VQVPRCCWCKATTWTSFLAPLPGTEEEEEAPKSTTRQKNINKFYAPLSGVVAKLAGIKLWNFGSFSYWFDKPWFHN
jgi:hypothetical protein